MLSTYFEYFIGYENDIFEGISNLHVQGAKFGRKRKIWRKIFKKVKLRRVHGFRFFQVLYE